MSKLVTVANVLALPFVLPHEATHWVVARLGTDDAQIAVEVSGGRAVAAWPPLDSRALRAFAFLAPTVFGSVLLALWLASGQGIDGWRLIFAIGLAGYTVPSPADVRGALGRQAVQKESDSECQ
jgi:hypothetical protein